FEVVDTLDDERLAAHLLQGDPAACQRQVRPAPAGGLDLRQPGQQVAVLVEVQVDGDAAQLEVFRRGTAADHIHGGEVGPDALDGQPGRVAVPAFPLEDLHASERRIAADADVYLVNTDGDAKDFLQLAGDLSGRKP